jgi:hypothetical protein
MVKDRSDPLAHARSASNAVIAALSFMTVSNVSARRSVTATNKSPREHDKRT